MKTKDILNQVESYNGKGSLPMLYAKSATGAITEWECWTLERYVYVSWGAHGGKKQESSFECFGKNEGRSNGTNAFQQAIIEAIAKWKKQVKKKYHWDLAVMQDETLRKGLANAQKPMLAKSYESCLARLKFPVYAQPKLNGVRCLATLGADGQVRLGSRGGDSYNVQHLSRELQGIFEHAAAEIIFDGEIYLHGASLQRIISLVKTPQEGSENLEFRCYDAILPRDEDAGFSHRWACVESVLEAATHNKPLDRVRPVPKSLCKTHEQVLEYQRKCIRLRYEGAMVRTLRGTYRPGYRSADLLKVKSWHDAEYEIVGHTVGKGKFSGVPIFRCKTEAGLEFDCTPEGSQKERAALLKRAPGLVGAMLTIKYRELSDDGKPLHLVGVAVREPKDLDK